MSYPGFPLSYCGGGLSAFPILDHVEGPAETEVRRNSGDKVRSKLTSSRQAAIVWNIPYKLEIILDVTRVRAGYLAFCQPERRYLHHSYLVGSLSKGSPDRKETNTSSTKYEHIGARFESVVRMAVL